jgi:transmembrane sensor
MDVKTLLPGLAAGTATPDEIVLFNDWLDQLPEDEFMRVMEKLEAAVAAEMNFEPYEEEWLERMKERISDEKMEERVFPGRERAGVWPLSPRRWAAAAAVLLVAGLLLLWNKLHKSSEVTITPEVADITPGRSGAVLTLEDGRIVTLDGVRDSVIAEQQGARVVMDKGQLLYRKEDKTTASLLSFNTVRTPRGRQFHILLPDNTGVWLNAASSIKYPIGFTGNERRVEVSGEVYFEVTRNGKMPFRVVAGDKTAIDVLGTAFNVKAYPDERGTETTLLEGSVRVGAGGSRQMLRAGEQVRVEAGSVAGMEPSLILLKNVDTTQVMAWKNGVFNFHLASLEEVMRQLSRWYDIRVEYEALMPGKRFDGEMGRDVNLSEVLEFLKGSGVHFRLDDNGKKIVIIR